MEQPKYAVDFPTLFIVPAWIQRHCIIPDGFRKGRPFRMYDWQLWVTLNHYRIKEDAEQDPDFLAGDPDAYPIRSAAFYYRRSQVVAPQKTGKGPWAAAMVCAEAVGPVLFYDWAAEGDVYRCADNGCDCGWVYKYQPGEAMGHAWPTPLIQLLATSEDQVENVMRYLRSMARGDRLKKQLKAREGFVRIIGKSDDPELDRIDAVTASALSRLGNPIIFCIQDETGLYTKENKLRHVAETMRRGAAAMGGRSIEMTNCWDPSEDSVAQRTHASKKKDIFRFYEPPPDGLNYAKKKDRAKIHAINYAGSPHTDLPGIEAEAAELAEEDLAQAERFFGNRIKAGTGHWLDGKKWNKRAPKKPRVIPTGTQVVLGFDGSDTDDWTGIRAETEDGYQFTPETSLGPTIWDPAEFKGQVPRLLVNNAVDELFQMYQVIAFYCDPPYWETDIDNWVERHGEDKVIRWYTRSPMRMMDAAQRLVDDVTKTDSNFSHDGCEITSKHIQAARTAKRPGSKYYTLTKPGDGRKIDMAVVSVLAHEAAGDAIAAGLFVKTDPLIYTASSTRLSPQKLRR